MKQIAKTATMPLARVILVSLVFWLNLSVHAQAREVQYTCTDKTVLAVTFSVPGASPAFARLVITGTPADIVLPQVLSADGGRYANEDLEFWVKGSSAQLTRDGGPVTICQVQ
jgi:membrane-bound inhibitor of C-type lysozyme